MTEYQNEVLVVLVVGVAVAAGICPWWSVSSVAQKDRPGVMGLLWCGVHPEKLGGNQIADPFRFGSLLHYNWLLAEVT